MSLKLYRAGWHVRYNTAGDIKLKTMNIYHSENHKDFKVIACLLCVSSINKLNPECQYICLQGLWIFESQYLDMPLRETPFKRLLHINAGHPTAWQICARIFPCSLLWHLVFNLRIKESCSILRLVILII